MPICAVLTHYRHIQFIITVVTRANGKDPYPPLEIRVLYAFIHPCAPPFSPPANPGLIEEALRIEYFSSFQLPPFLFLTIK